MAEYVKRVDVNAACYNIYEEVVREHKAMTAEEVKQTMLRFEKAINLTPAADVVEVKHGEWITESKNGSEEVCRCTVCNDLLSFFGFYKAKYCSNCGAKMDGTPQKEG